MTSANSDQWRFSSRKRIGHLLEGTVFYGILAVIALSAVPYGTVDAWWEAVFESAVFLLTILAIVECLLTCSTLVRDYRLLLPLFALVLFALIQSISWRQSADGPALAGRLVHHTLSANAFETWRFSLKLLAVTLILGLLFRYASSAKRLRLLVFLVIGVATASAVFGLLRTRLPQTLLTLTGSRLVPDGSYGQFENRNHFALLMEMAIGLVVGVALTKSRHWGWLALCILSSLILWTALLLTHSRGGVVSLMFEIPVFFLLYSRFVRSRPKNNLTTERNNLPLLKNVAVATLLVAAVATSVILISGDETIYRLQTTPAEFTARDVGPPKILRPEIWRATLTLIRDHPLVGVGFAAYSVAIPRYLNASGEWTPQQAHNDYLEVLASGGVIGGLLCAWFGVALVRTACMQLRSGSLGSRAIKCGALGGLFAVAVHSLFDFGLHITVNALICAALITIVVKSASDKTVAA